VKLNKLLTILFTLFLITPLIAQKGGAPPTEEEEDYYLFPVNPGERGSLSGTMGELRSTHFHTGIDIRTGGKTGLPVHSVAEGDIVRIAVSPSGYGNALYIQHPNNTFSVYAHLEKFYGPIADYVRQEQYKRKRWDIDLYFTKGRFSVHKGDTIAFSGNSGSSGGPHLHFDLRDANHDLLNPLKHNFEEVWDQTPPVARALAVKTLDKDSRVENTFGRKEFNLKPSGTNYVIEEPIDVYGNIGFEIYAYDLLDNSSFRTGITEIEVFIDGEVVHRQEINTFSFSDQRNILVHMPYRELQTSRQRFHKLYIDDGNKLRIYKSKLHNGLKLVEEDCEYPVKIVMRDTYNNESSLSFSVRCKRPEIYVEDKSLGNKASGEVNEDVIDNTLKITISKKRNESHNNILLYKAGINYELAPDYVIGQDATYLWDLREGLPDSANYCGIKKDYNFEAMIPSEKEFHFYNSRLNIHFPVNSLFDTLYLETNYKKENGQEFFTFGNVFQPVRRYLTVTLKPEEQYDPKYYSIYSVDPAGNLYYQGGSWKDNTVTFRTRDFSTYTIAADKEPPMIRPVKLSQDELRFKISDKMTGIKSYELTIDDEWIMMHYDYKQDLIWSEKLHDEQKFSGNLKLRVTDSQGNEKFFTRKL
jgi:hypothetical protein